MITERFVRQMIADESRILRESFTEDLRRLRNQVNLRPDLYDVASLREELRSTSVNLRREIARGDQQIIDLHEKLRLLDHFTPKTQSIRRPTKVLFDDGTWEEMN